MEEQFILRVPPSVVAERIERLLNESPSDDKSLDLSFSCDDTDSPASTYDLSCIVVVSQTYDDMSLDQNADVWNQYMVPSFYTSFSGEPELVRRVERDLLNIMHGGTAENFDILPILQTH
ncbi:transcription initiation factor TFIID subunit 7 [Tanacetum coccineum]